uniref:Hepatitis TT virus Orf2/Gyrovirus Vp2 N-terminal domain-containing protein n=1 Tax=Torque teno mini virus 9 TaxID=687377 RepID=Q9JG48_9VIRU|nr:unnamed protein product [Torque teno mini virus 9]
MSRYIPTKSTLRQKKLQWMNLIVHGHDIFCDCCKPLECTIGTIINQEPNLKFNTEEKNLLKKCLSTKDGDAGAGAADPDGFGEGDLDALFTEDFGEENTG